MSSSRFTKSFFVVLLCLLVVAIGQRIGVGQQLLRWCAQIYLGQILGSRVTIEEVRGGFLSGITLKNTRLYQSSVATPLFAADEITTDFRILGRMPKVQHCVLTRPRIFFQECLSSLGEFSIPPQRPLILLPRGDFWRKTRFSLFRGIVVESANRQDNVLLGDLVGSAEPAGNNMLEFFFGTARTSSLSNKIQVYGTVHTTKGSSNVDFNLELGRLDDLNLFLRGFHVLKGTARLDGKIRSAKLESAELEFRGVNLSFAQDKRILRGLQGKISTSEQYVAVKEFKAQSEGLDIELTGDAQRVFFKRGEVDIDRLLAKSRILAQDLSSQPMDLDLEASITIYYRHSQTLTKLSWGKELLESLCLWEGKLGIGEFMDLQIRGKYMPGKPVGLDYKIISVDFNKIKKDWFGEKLGSLFSDVRISGDGKAQCLWDRVELAGLLDWDQNRMPYRMLWAQRQLKLEEFHVDDATTLLGRFDFDNREKSELVFSFQDESMARLLSAIKPDKKASMTGKFTGTLEFRGNLLDPSILGVMNLRNGSWRGIPFREGQINVAGKFPRIYLDRSIIYIKKDIPVALSGFIDLTLPDIFKNVASEKGSAVHGRGNAP